METITSDVPNFDFLVKQTFEEFRNNEIQINRFGVTFTMDNIPNLDITFENLTDYEKYVKLYKDNGVQQITLRNFIFSIDFKFGPHKTIYTMNVQDITSEWIMQNLPPNVLVFEYHRMCSNIYPLDKLPRNLDLLLITELETASNLDNLPSGLTKLNLHNCFHVKHNLGSLPSSLKLLILSADYCEAINSYEAIRTYYYTDFRNLPNSLETICYGKLKMTPRQFKNFVANDYMKYNRTFDNSANMFDLFLSEFIFGRKKYFMTKYEFNDNGWYQLAME